MGRQVQKQPGNPQMKRYHPVSSLLSPVTLGKLVSLYVSTLPLSEWSLASNTRRRGRWDNIELLIALGQALCKVISFNPHAKQVSLISILEETETQIQSSHHELASRGGKV